MGLFSGITKAIGKVAGVVSDLSPIGSLIGGFATNSANKANAQAANAFTKEQLQNRHQWEVQDLLKAGLNPILSAGGTPSIGGSAKADTVNVGELTSNSARANAMNKAQLESIDATIRKTNADTATALTQAALNKAAINKTNADTALVTNSASNAAMNNQLLRASLPAALNNAGVDNSTTGKVLNWINRVSASLQGTAGAVNSAKSAVTKKVPFVQVHPR